MSRLLVIKGPNVGVHYDLGERTRLGRLGENEIQVLDPNVSRTHAEIVKDRHAYIITDRGSKNGLLVNGEAVREKVLLKNDEIQIGHTVFAFNSDLNIQNARFSNNSVYLYPAADETLQGIEKFNNLSKLSGRDRESVDFVLKFADLFSETPKSVVETTEHLARQIKELFQSDHSIVLLKEFNNESLRPAVALPEGKPVSINRGLIATACEDKCALLSSENIAGPLEEGISPDDDEDDKTDGKGIGKSDYSKRTVDSEIERELRNAQPAFTIPTSSMVAPIVQDDVVIGMLVVEKQELDHYSIKDLGLLQAVAKLAGGMLQSARIVERVNISVAEQKQSETSEIISSRSLRMQEIYNLARRTAESDVTILLSGETGTGKEVLARFIHENSHRANGPFVAINCGNIPAGLFESEIFGYEKGAFTGAAQTTLGKVEIAQGGTLFLDEIGELDISLQPKLLRFLQDKAFYRVGGNKAINADVRIISATNVDLSAAVRSGTFREDLWYRLNVVPFTMPPLRERREDIGPLTDALIGKFSAKLQRKVLGANDAAISLLQKYDWPGNIRELENAIERAVLLAQSKILSLTDFGHIEEARRRLSVQNDIERKRDTRPLAEVERQHIIIALKKYNYNQARAAEALGLHRNTLRNKIIEYGIDISKQKEANSH